MTERGFEPLSGQLGISGTSYRVQLGLINEKWAARILKGKDILDSYIFKDEDITDGGGPNQNIVVGYVLRTVQLPNINPYGVMRTVQALVKQSLEKKDQKKFVATVAEAKSVELEKVPEEELKRSKVVGWVKEDGQKTQAEIEEEKRKAFKERMAAKKVADSTDDQPIKEESAKPELAATAAPANTIKTTRALPKIPSVDSKEEPSIAEPPKEDHPKVTPSKTEMDEYSNFCPSCGKDISWRFCPFCGKPLPHS